MSINATDNVTVIKLNNVTYGRILKIFGGLVQLNGQIMIADQVTPTAK